MGTLRIQGQIDINQFWPAGSSDADTTKIKLIVGSNSFKYRAGNSGAFKTTKVYYGAKSKGSITSEVVKTSKKTGEQTITVRLQGVDAPELHYKASPLKKTADVSDAERAAFNEINEERRQCFAESATVALAIYLSQFADNKGMIKATFETQVDAPHEAVDTYGRFVGNIIIGNKKDINLWLVENGWGLPAFYTSMKTDEIDLFLKAWKKGKTKKNRTGKAITTDLNHFDWDLIYRKPPVEEDFSVGDDKGAVIYPKVYRRQVAWQVSAHVGIHQLDFKSYLAKSPDQLVMLDEFLDNEGDLNTTTVYALHDCIDDNNKLTSAPHELIFKEKPGKLINSKDKEIVKW